MIDRPTARRTDWDLQLVALPAIADPLADLALPIVHLSLHVHLIQHLVLTSLSLFQSSDSSSSTSSSRERPV